MLVLREKPPPISHSAAILSAVLLAILPTVAGCFRLRLNWTAARAAEPTATPAPSPAASPEPEPSAAPATPAPSDRAEMRELVEQIRALRQRQRELRAGLARDAAAMEQLARDIRARSRELETEAGAAAPASPTPGPSPSPPPGPSPPPSPAATPPRAPAPGITDREARELLRLFPPEDGWSEERARAIALRLRREEPVTPTEWRFLDVYQRWLQACRRLRPDNP